MFEIHPVGHFLPFVTSKKMDVSGYLTAKVGMLLTTYQKHYRDKGMRYARLNKVSESNTCNGGRVLREQVLTVASCGAVETMKGIVHLHPMHIGRTVRIVRDLSKKVNRDFTFIR